MTTPEQRLASIREYFDASAKVKLALFDRCGKEVERAALLMADAFKAGNKILLCGNGGSAADCQHVAAEFVSRLTKDYVRPAMPAIALTTDTSFLTAYANDCDYEGIFERQVEALGKPGDVVWGISTSGSSKNVKLAFAKAKALKMSTVLLAGEGGDISALSTIAIHVPSKNTQHIQESHLAIEHIICHMIERLVYPK